MLLEVGFDVIGKSSSLFKWRAPVSHIPTSEFGSPARLLSVMLEYLVLEDSNAWCVVLRDGAWVQSGSKPSVMPDRFEPESCNSSGSYCALLWGNSDPKKTLFRSDTSLNSNSGCGGVQDALLLEDALGSGFRESSGNCK